MNSKTDDLKRFTQPIGVLLDRFIAANQSHFPAATGELTQLLRDIAWAAKIINKEINRAGLVGLEKETTQQNIQGETQKILDQVAHIRFTKALSKGGQTCGIASEEAEDLIETGNNQAKYVVCIDPLDGSANIGVNIPVGTIFSIFRRKSGIGSLPVKDDFLQKGTEQVAAGYVVYGSSTMLVYSAGHGVNGFTYEPSYGEFLLSHPMMEINVEGNTISINESNCHTFEKGIKKYIEHCKTQKFKTYYTGSLISDFHRNLITGGIYIYPSSDHYPQGKLRLLYECSPLAFIIEQAGGAATNGHEKILDLMPAELHQRSQLFIGSKNLVQEASDLLQ